jgi:hypothetical protein
MTTEQVAEKRRHIASILVTSVGLILFWRGIWDMSEKFFSPEVSLVVGLSMLVSAAIIERKHLFRFLY